MMTGEFLVQVMEGGGDREAMREVFMPGWRWGSRSSEAF
jgi:hypothetical protein